MFIQPCVDQFFENFWKRG